MYVLITYINAGTMMRENFPDMMHVQLAMLRQMCLSHKADH